MTDTLERWLGTLFGLIFVALSLVVTAETLLRKLFNISLQGADELGGYALAVGATIGFSLALLGRSHIRVDVFHDRLPRGLQSALNLLSVLALAAFALLLAWLAWFVIGDTRQYMSVAQTPWATPLQYPQSVWLVGLIVFALAATALALRAIGLLLRGRTDQLASEFGPRTTNQEVDEELADLRARSGSAAPAATTPLRHGARA